MITQLMTITPELATQWLNQNPNNRPLRPIRVRQYAEDIKAGMWKLTHQGIAFYEDGTLADGQHRLKAVEMANLPIAMYVTTGLNKNSSVAIDAGKPREMVDTMHIINGQTWVNKDIVAIARIALTKLDLDGRAISGYVLQNYVNKHKEKLLTTNKFFYKKKRALTTALVQCGVFAALHDGEDKAKLMRFAHILVNGEISGPSENAAIRVREMLLSDAVYSRVEMMKRIQRGIYAFCKGESIKRLHCPEDLIYTIPE